MTKQLVTYATLLTIMQVILCRANQLMSIACARLIEDTIGTQQTWPMLTRWVLLHPGFAYLIPLMLCGFLVAGIAKKNDRILMHGIALNATGFCLYILVRLFANILPFAGTIIGRLE